MLHQRKGSLAFILNQEEEPNLELTGDFTCQPGTSNALQFSNSDSLKKRKAATSLNNSASKQRRLESNDPKEEIVEQIRVLKERALKSTKSSKSNQQRGMRCTAFPTPSPLIQNLDIDTCRRNKLLVQQLLRDTLPLCKQQQDGSNDLFACKRERASPEQVAFLERVFVLDPLPSATTRSVIAAKLGMTPKRVQVWFQNKRARLKAAQPSPYLLEESDGQARLPAFLVASSTSSSSSSQSRGRRGSSGDMFTFHNLAICDDGKLVLCSEGVPPLILKPTLQRDTI